MNRPLLALGVAAAALLALSGCTAAAAPAPAASPSASASASATAFTCPTPDEVAGLTALPFSASAADTAGTDGGCAYTAASDGGNASLTITRRAAAAGRTTLTGFRYQQIEQGRTTTDATALSFDAFTVRSGASCSAWLTAGDGVVTTVTAAGVPSAAVCPLARAAAVLVQGGATTARAPIVSVVAPEGLLGSAARTTALAARLGSVAGARVGLLASAGAGFSVRDGERTVASQVQPRADAVVLVAGTADAGRDRLTVLEAASATLSQAGGTAPGARLVVVGPLLDGSAPAADVLELRDTLSTAARIADATFIDPIAEGWGTTAPPVTRDEADRITRSLTDEVAAAIG